MKLIKRNAILMPFMDDLITQGITVKNDLCYSFLVP
jgi:hypothetical protein